jgi:hypothetical protein
MGIEVLIFFITTAMDSTICFHTLSILKVSSVYAMQVIDSRKTYNGLVAI